tara:strand:- start:283 stop:507 length:225 start_codon:yes stop_codon:yes gene_type:complete
MTKRAEAGYTTHNKLAKKITEKVSRPVGPTSTTISKWKREWIKLGLDFKMTFQSYKKIKINMWWKERRRRKNHV